jgi:gas vesicle protein
VEFIMSDSDSEFGSFLAGFVIGGLVGAAVALVLAPQSGAETRSKITGKGHELADAGEQRYHQAVESMDGYAHQAGDRARQIGQDVESQARIILDAGRQENNNGDSESAPPENAGDEAEAETS